MATLKEWIRDFKKKPKWDQFSIIFTIVSSIVGLIFGGQYIINNINISNNQSINVSVSNSTKFMVNINSPNSPLTITETRFIPENCAGEVYTKKISMNLTKFFSTTDICGTGIDQNLIYDLYNVIFELPSHQQVFLDRVLAGESYNIAYMTDDYSDACIPHKYKITSDFIENKVCFKIIFGENVCANPITLVPGPLFKSNKAECFRKISGETDRLSLWNPI